MTTEVPDPTWDRHVGGCLYCGRPGPYSDEHVVSAGMGGDDKAWMLRGCVCRVCNTVVFSKLEAKVLKEGVTSLARLHEQPTTRDRKQAPTMDTHATLLRSEKNRWAVAEYLAGGVAGVRPQIMLEHLENEDHFGLAAPDETSLESFRAAVEQLLAQEFPLVRKDESKQIWVTPLHWSKGRYAPGREARADRVPTQGVWMGRLVAPPEPPDAVLPWTLYQRREGQLVCNVPDTETAALLLTRIRLNHAAIFPRPDATPAPSRIENPEVFLRIPEDPEARTRVLAKTGLNLLAHLVASDFMRDPCFDPAVNYVFGRAGATLRHGQAPANAFGPPNENHHDFILAAKRLDAHGPWHIQLIARVYGMQPMILLLGRCPSVPSALEAPIIVHVDYTRHEIRQQTLEQHAAALACRFAGIQELQPTSEQ